MKQSILMATKAFLILVAIYLSLGLVAYLVPDAPVVRHIKQTVDNGDLCEDYPKAIIVNRPDTQDPYTLDNFTDALILNQVLHLRSEGLRGILLMARHDEGIHQYNNLIQSLRGSTEGRTIYYPRYWHGSTFLARIMLALTSYAGVRYFLYLLSSLLLLWCLMRLWQAAGKAVALVFAFGLLAVDLFVMQFSLQFVQVLLIACGAACWLTRSRAAEGHRPSLLFFIVGSLTAFLDLLTVPTITLGLPLVVLVALRREGDLRRGITLVVATALWWAAGYALTWVAKWGLATLLTDINTFSDAFDQGSRWSEGSGSYLADAFSTTASYTHWKYLFLALVALVAAALFRRRRKAWPLAVQYALVALIPLAYYLLMARPTAHHAWFAYRALATSAIALLMLVASQVDWQACRAWFTAKTRKQQ